MKESTRIDYDEYLIEIKFWCKDCGKHLELKDKLAIECPKCGKRYILDIYESPYQPNKGKKNDNNNQSRT